MKTIIFATIALTGLMAQAKNTEFVTSTSCVSSAGGVVNIEKRVVDIYTPNAKIEERVTLNGQSLGVAERSASSNTSTSVYAGAQYELTLVSDYSSLVVDAATATYTVKGEGTLKVRGQADQELDCETSDAM